MHEDDPKAQRPPCYRRLLALRTMPERDTDAPTPGQSMKARLAAWRAAQAATEAAAKGNASKDVKGSALLHVDALGRISG